MTWQNALFVGVGTALLGLIEWGRHRFEQLPIETRRNVMIGGFIAVVILGLIVLAAAVWPNSKQ